MIRLISLCCGIYFIVSPVVQAQCNIIASQLRHEYGKVRFQDTEPTGQVQWQQLPARQVQVQVRCDVPQPIHIRFDDNDRRGLDFSFGEEDGQR